MNEADKTRVEDWLDAYKENIERTGEEGNEESIICALVIMVQAQQAEIERLKEANEHWHTRVEQMKSQLTAAKEEIERLNDCGQAGTYASPKVIDQLTAERNQHKLSLIANAEMWKAKVEKLREVLSLALTGINSDVYPSCWRVVQQALTDTEGKG